MSFSLVSEWADTVNPGDPIVKVDTDIPHHTWVWGEVVFSKKVFLRDVHKSDLRMSFFQVLYPNLDINEPEIIAQLMGRMVYGMDVSLLSVVTLIGIKVGQVTVPAE